MLNSKQQQFCDLDLRTPIRLLAPAGCGKTQSLLWRCRALVERAAAAGTSPPRMLLFTFTRAARDELQTRVTDSPEFAILGPHIRIVTLNAWGYRRLRSSHQQLQLLKNAKDQQFAMLTTLRPVWSKHEAIARALSDSRLAHRIARMLMTVSDRLKSLGFRHWQLASADDATHAVERLVTIGMEAHLLDSDRSLCSANIMPAGTLDDLAHRLHQHFIPFWRNALNALHATHSITLEDQKYLALKDLNDQLATGTTWRGAASYDVILVDEFQDINPLDLDLLKALSAITAAPLTIVGDDDQAIYEWRGASPSFILEPQSHIGQDFTTCILDTNYRSPRNIVDHSQHLIRHNQRRVDKAVRAHRDADAHIEIRVVNDIRGAMAEVLPIVEAMRTADGPPRRIALIARKRSQLIPYQIMFASRGIEFFAAEDLSIFLSDAFERLVKALETRSAIGASVGAAWGFEPVSMTLALCDVFGRFPLSKTHHRELRAHLQGARPNTLNDALTALRRFSGRLSSPVADFANALEALFAAPTVQAALAVLGRQFAGMQQDYARAEDDIFYTDPPFLHLADYAAAYRDDFAAFIRDLRAARDTLSIPIGEDDGIDTSFKRPVHLMTALRAKGKEFDTVVILDANDGVWPSRLATTNREQEAERRVFYVAVTRAREHLLFLVSRSVGGDIAVPSPYLAEMGLL